MSPVIEKLDIGISRAGTQVQQSWGSRLAFLKFFGPSPHGYNMAAAAPRITSSLHRPKWERASYGPHGIGGKERCLCESLSGAAEVQVWYTNDIPETVIWKALPLSGNSQRAMLLWICSTFHKAAMCDRNLTSEPPEHRLSLGHQGAVAFSLNIKWQ